MNEEHEFGKLWRKLRAEAADVGPKDLLASPAQLRGVRLVPKLAKDPVSADAALLPKVRDWLASAAKSEGSGRATETKPSVLGAEQAALLGRAEARERGHPDALYAVARLGGVLFPVLLDTGAARNMATESAAAELGLTVGPLDGEAFRSASGNMEVLGKALAATSLGGQRPRHLVYYVFKGDEEEREPLVILGLSGLCTLAASPTPTYRFLQLAASAPPTLVPLFPTADAARTAARKDTL